MTNTTTDRNTTAPNGNTFEQFEQFVAGLESEGRGAKGTFSLIDPEGMDIDGLGIDLLCLDDGGTEFHGGMYDFTADHSFGVMTTEFVLGEFWANVLQAAWNSHDNTAAARED